MKSYQRLLIFVLLVLALTALISPWAATAWDLISGAGTAAPEDRIPFSRFFDPGFLFTKGPSADHFEIKIHGLESHAGVAPELGISAIRIAAEAISAMKLYLE